jgi:hypothetical protein
MSIHSWKKEAMPSEPKLADNVPTVHHPILAFFYQCCTVLSFSQRKTDRVRGTSKSLKSASENRQVPSISKPAEPKEPLAPGILKPLQEPSIFMIEKPPGSFQVL